MKLEDLKAKLQKLDKIPEGFKTRQEWQAIWKLGKSQCNDLIARAKKERLCVVKKFRAGPGSPINHYKFNE